jgi:hypothetical protein
MSYYEKGPHNEYAAPHQDFNAPPPGYAATSLPASGFRIALNSEVGPWPHNSNPS